jgi:hypothetical protein
MLKKWGLDAQHTAKKTSTCSASPNSKLRILANMMDVSKYEKLWTWCVCYVFFFYLSQFLLLLFFELLQPHSIQPRIDHNS